MEKRQLSERVAGHVRESIMVGELRAPAYVRVERLAAELGVSATPVREALMILSSEGTLRWEPRRGFRVVPLTRSDVADVFAVQAHIAGELAARAAVVVAPGEVARLRRVQHDLEAAARAGDAPRVDRLNHDIHRTINKAPGAHRLAAMLAGTVHYVPLEHFGRIEGWADASAHDHEAIFAALDAGDPEPARRAMAEHIHHVGRLLLDHLAARGVIEGTTVARQPRSETSAR